MKIKNINENGKKKIAQKMLDMYAHEQGDIKRKGDTEWTNVFKNVDWIEFENAASHNVDKGHTQTGKHQSSENNESIQLNGLVSVRTRFTGISTTTVIAITTIRNENEIIKASNNWKSE